MQPSKSMRWTLAPFYGIVCAVNGKESNMKTIRENKFCFALGMGIPIVGLVVAAVIRGEAGAKAALAGLAFGVYVVACALWFFQVSLF